LTSTTEVHELKTIHTIPFSSKKVEELSEYFADRMSFIVVDRATGRKHSCSRHEFQAMDYEELIDIKTGFTEWKKARQQARQLFIVPNSKQISLYVTVIPSAYVVVILVINQWERKIALSLALTK
jgi:hypothetical protein